MDKLLLPFFNGRTVTELSGDFILPDTYPDVKRILRVKATPIALGRFISGGKLDLNGAVDYVVIFSAETESGKDSLHAVHFAADYQSTVTPDDSKLLGEGCEIAITPSIGSCTARLQNPRKLSIRSSVINDVKLAKMTSRAPKIDGARTAEEESKLERLTSTQPTLLERLFTADHLKLSENCEPDATQPAIDEIVTCSADIRFFEAKLTKADGRLNCAIKGEVLIDCLYKSQSEPGDYRSFSRKLPLSYIVDASDCLPLFESAKDETLTCAASGILTELNASVGENSYGERRILELDLDFDVELRVLADSDVTLTLDAYSTEREYECRSEKLALTSLCKLISSNFSVSEGVARESLQLAVDPEQPLTPIDSSAELELSLSSVERGRAQLIGEASVNCIMSDGTSFIPVDFRIPVKCELSIGDVREPLELLCETHATDLRVRVDRGRICCDFEAALNAILLRRSECYALGEIRLGEQVSDRRTKKGTMILCYPHKGESLWQIAKRYSTTRASIIAGNPGITEGSRVVVIG